MSDFVAFLVFIFRVIQFVLELVLDIVLFALYCVGLAAVWRLPWNLQALGKCNSRSDYRFTCLLSFGTLLLDLVCLPLGFASLAAFWRWPWSVPLFFAVDMREEYDAEVRLHLFANFFIMLGDLLVLPFVALSTVSLIHIPDLLDAIKEALGESDSDLCYSADLRWTIVALGLGSLIDILFVPTFLIALLSWRHSEVWQEVKEHTGWERRLVGIFFFFTLLVDIFFFVLIIFLTCTLWRAGPLWRELRECKDLDSIRKPTMRQLALFFRDMPFVLLFFVLVGTLWRAINTIARVFGLFRPMSLSPEPAVMQVESCRFEFPEAGGARIHYRCRKPVDFALAPGAQVKLYVVDASGSFWTKAETVLGSAAAIVAKNMLPLSLAGTYLDPAVLEQAGGEDTVEFTVLFNQAVKRSTIVKKLRAIGAPEFLIHLQAEDSASLRTLASVRTSGTAIIESAEHDQPLASVGSDLHVTVAAFAQAQEDAEWRDSFIVIVGMNFVQLMLDLIYLVMFALCAIAPWRLLVCMYLLTEHKDIWPLRVRQKMVQMVAMTRTIHADMRDAIVNRSHLALKFYRPRVVLQNPGVINQLWSAFKRTVSNSSGSHASHVHDPDWPFGVTYPEHYVPETDRRKHDIEGAFLNLDHAVSEGDIFFSYGGVYSLVAEALEAGAEKLQRKKPEDLSAFTEPPQPSHLAPSEEAAPERERHVLELMEVTEMGSVAPVEGLVAELEAAGQEPVGILDSSELINSHNRAENVLAYLFILEHQLAKAFRNETITRRTYDAFQATVVGAQVRARARLDALSRAVEHRFGEIAALTAGCHFSCKHMFTRSTSQYRKIVAAMFQGALFDIFSIVFFFVNIGLLYRAGDMIRAWRRASVWEWKRIEVLRIGFEYLQDLVFVIESVVIFGTLFSAIDFMVDLAGCANTPDRRRTGHRYFVGVFSDLWRWFTMLFSLRLFTYAIASTVFGFLVPAATVNELLVGSVHSKFWRRLSAITIWFGFLLYPIIVIQDIIPSMAEDLGDVVSGPLSLAADTPVFSNSNVDKISALVAVYFGLLFAVVVGSVVLASQREEFKSVYQPSKTVSTSAPNVFVIFYILFDALQLSSVAWAVFAFNQTPVEFQNDSENDSASPTFGSMKAISAAVLFFEEGSFIIIISIALALVGLWYLVISTPTVIEEFFDGEKGAITESAGWKYTVGLLGNTLYLSIVFSLFKALQCRYTTVNPGAAGTEYKVGVLHGDADEVCWDLDEKQAALATASLVLVAFYLFTSHLFATESNALNVTANEELDIRFPIVDQLAVNTAKILISGCILLFPTKPWVMLSLVLAGGAFLYLWTASYERIFGTPVCHIAWVTTFRMGIYVTVMWSAICAMLEQRRRDTNGDEVKVDTVLMFFVGVGVIVFFTFLPIWWRRRKARIEREKAMAAAGIKDAIEQLVAIEADMFEAGALVPAWAKQRERWRSQMENIKRPLSMAHRVMELERHTRVRALSRAFLNYRIMWIMGQLNPGLVNWSTLSSALPDSAAADASWAGPMFPKGHVLRNNVIVPSASSNAPAEFARGRPLELDEVASAIQCYVKSLRRIESQPFPGMDEFSSDMRPMDAQIGSARQNWVGQLSGLASTIVDAAAFRAQERVRANNGDESARARIAEARSVLQAGASALASAGKQWIVGRFGGNDGADEDMDEVRIEEPAPLPAEPAGKWACSGCTFLNEPATTNCAMCDTRRG